MMRQKIEDQSIMDKEMHKEIRDEFVVASLERCAVEDDRKTAEEEREAARAEREQEELPKPKDKWKQRREKRQRLSGKRIKTIGTPMLKGKDKNSETNLLSIAHTPPSFLIRLLTRGTLDTQLRLFKDKTEADNHRNFSVRDDIRSERAPGTRKWLLEHSVFRDWKKRDCERPILWLNGKHGSGKSFLCGSAIDEISSEPPRKGVAFYFITKDKYRPRSHLLRNLASQLLSVLETLAIGELPPSIESFVPIWIGTAKVESLIHDLLQGLPMAFIFIDGLDEADYIDRPESIVQGGELLIFVKFLIKEAIHLLRKVRL
ncbi:hypothetical protein CGCF413_v015498 [Colletotrichum fructicola]|nr:hypothetical protein CGCF413_v015498 [Colletotrichum fructicola]